MSENKNLTAAEIKRMLTYIAGVIARNESVYGHQFR